METPWVRDGLNELERDLAAEIMTLFEQKDGLETLQVLRMKFLRQAGPGDLEAVRSLRKIRGRSQQEYGEIMELLGTDIGDQDTPRIVLMQTSPEGTTKLARRLLDPGTAVVSRNTNVRKSGRIRLSVVVPAGISARPLELLDVLGENIRDISALMEEPFRHRMVTLLVSDSKMDGVSGANFGDGIILKPAGHQEGEIRRIITHGVAHYYWRDNAHWIDEGMANHITSLLENRRTGRRLGTTRWPCGTQDRIEDLPTGQEQASECDHSLGSRIFLDLHLHLDESSMMRRMRDLYRQSRTHDPENGTSLTMENLRSLFPEHSHHEGRKWHREDQGILDRWEKGEGNHREDQWDETKPNPGLQGVSGRIKSVGILVDNEPLKIIRNDARNRDVRLRVVYNHRGESGEFQLELVTLHEDGMPILGPEVRVSVKKGNNIGYISVRLGPGKGETWAEGEYVTYVYEEGQKVGEASWTVRQ